MDRRKFITSLMTIAGAAFLSQSRMKGILESSALAAGDKDTTAKLSMVDPKDTMATALKYGEDYKKIPAAKGSKCSGCQLYAKKEMSNGKEVGTCSIFQGKLVYGNAYCNSFTKKA